MSSSSRSAASAASPTRDDFVAPFHIQSTVDLTPEQRAQQTPKMLELVDGIIQTIIDAPTDIDPALGYFSRIAALTRACVAQEGYLLEKTIAFVARLNPDLLVLPRPPKLPLVPAALEAIEHNNISQIQGLRFSSDIRVRKTYTPDLVFIDRRTSDAYLIEVKRNLSVHQEAERSELRKRMLAASTVLRDVLYQDHQNVPVRKVYTVIIDAARNRGPVESGIWSIWDLDGLTGVSDGPEIANTIRALYAERVDQLLETETQRLVAAAANPLPRHTLLLPSERSRAVAIVEARRKAVAGVPQPINARSVPVVPVAPTVQSVAASVLPEPVKRPRGRPRKVQVEDILFGGGVSTSSVPVTTSSQTAAPVVATAAKPKKAKKLLGPPRPGRPQRPPEDPDVMAHLDDFLNKLIH